MYLIYKAEEFVCLDAIISETAGPNLIIIFVLDSPFIEEGCRPVVPKVICTSIMSLKQSYLAILS